MTWAELEAAAPELAAAGRAQLYRAGTGRALLATVRGTSLPRIHPITIAIVGQRLYAFILRSAKGRDLELDGRYALHAHQDPLVPDEFLLRGRAQLVETESVRTTVAADWPFTVDDGYRLFEFSIESALLGTRSSNEDWPPAYVSWPA